MGAPALRWLLDSSSEALVKWDHLNETVGARGTAFIPVPIVKRPQLVYVCADCLGAPSLPLSVSLSFFFLFLQGMERR